MKKTHRVALKPTPEQESLFGQHAGYARFAYNWAVGEFKAGLDVGEWLSEKTLRVFQMSNNGYIASVSWVLASVLGLVLPSSGAVSPMVESPSARAAPSGSITFSPTASSASFSRLRAAFSLRS